MPFMVIQDIKKPHPVVHQSQTAHQIQQFSLSKEMEQLDHQIQDFKKRYYQSDFYKHFVDYRQTLRTQVFKPLSSAYNNTYTELPQETTKRKFGILERFSFDQRFIFLNGLALGSAVLSMRRINQFNGWTIGVNSFRNTALTYLFAGLIFAPEIFNPLLKGWEKITIY